MSTRIEKAVAANIVAAQARWIYIAAIALIGAVSKIAGSANVNFSLALMGVMLVFAFLYNFFPSWYIKNKLHPKSHLPVDRITFVQFLIDILTVTLIIRFAGGIESISFIFYFFVIVSASFIYKRTGVYLTTFFSFISYNVLIYGEYFGLLPHISRFPYSDPLLFRNLELVLVNTLTVSLAIITSGYFVGYLSASRAYFEESAERERLKRVADEKRTDEIRSKFVTVLSHQFRTPLTHIKLALAELMENRKELDFRQKGLIEEGQVALARALLILDRLIKMRDLEEKKHHFHQETMDIVQCLKDCVKELNFMAKRNSLDIKTDFGQNEKVLIMASPLMISSVFEAVLENAIDYGYPHTDIGVKLSVSGRDVLVTVRNTGVPIKEKDKRKIFTKFFRTDEALKKTTDKSGLSLYLVKLIIKKHKGRIWFDSHPDGETTFFIKLPAISNSINNSKL